MSMNYWAQLLYRMPLRFRCRRSRLAVHLIKIIRVALRLCPFWGGVSFFRYLCFLFHLLNTDLPTQVQSNVALNLSIVSQQYHAILSPKQCDLQLPLMPQSHPMFPRSPKQPGLMPIASPFSHHDSMLHSSPVTAIFVDWLEVRACFRPVIY